MVDTREGKREFTQAELTARDGRVWTPEECELMAEWWNFRGDDWNKLNALEPVIAYCLGENWVDLPDPPAVDILRGIDP